MSSEAIKKFLDGFSVEVTPKAASKIENFLNDFSIEVTPNAAKKINQFSLLHWV